MTALAILLVVGLLLAGGFVAFFVWNASQRNHDYYESLALLPLETHAPLPNQEKQS